MAPSIDIDDEVFALLKEQAEPFVDTPNSTLRRLLELDAAGESPAATPTGKRTRAPFGSLLPESEYELPILQELKARGGSAPGREVIAAVGERLADRLTELDKQPLNSGDIRWQNRVAFTRLTLKERGLLKSDSPRGIWELSDDGFRRAEEAVE